MRRVKTQLLRCYATKPVGSVTLRDKKRGTVRISSLERDTFDSHGFLRGYATNKAVSEMLRDKIGRLVCKM